MTAKAHNKASPAAALQYRSVYTDVHAAMSDARSLIRMPRWSSLCRYFSSGSTISTLHSPVPLPTELLVQIFQYLPATEIALAQKVRSQRAPDSCTVIRVANVCIGLSDLSRHRERVVSASVHYRSFPRGRSGRPGRLVALVFSCPAGPAHRLEGHPARKPLEEGLGGCINRRVYLVSGRHPREHVLYFQL